MATRVACSFCRICSGSCAVRLTVQDDRIVAIQGDRDSPLTHGYACFKGVQAGAAHHSPHRLLHPLQRQPDGSFRRIGLEDALDGIAARLAAIRDRDGPEAIGLYVGNGAFPNATVVPLHHDFMRALGSASRFTSATIDQSAKMVSAERLGGWAAPKPHLDQCNVAMVLGGNPLVSHQTSGIVDVDPTRRLKQAKQRGLKLIVIDPRRHETARHADLFLQPYPGQDAAILAAMLRTILDAGWQDQDFCAAHVGADGMAALRRALEPFEEARVAAAAGLVVGELHAAAEMFAQARQSLVYAFTGTTMGPYSNVAQHLADVLNVVCGRFLRAGDGVLTADMFEPAPNFRAEVIPPTRSWEQGGMSRIGGARTMFGEKMTGTMAAEILTPGPGRVRALLMHGGNPASSVPDQDRMVRALHDLELAVTIDPFMTNTARLSQYVLPTRMQYERADLPLSLYGTLFYPRPWIQYAPVVVPPPAGSELAEDWYIFWSLAKRLGLAIDYAGRVPLDMNVPPTTDDLLAIRAAHPDASLDEIRRHEHGMGFERMAPPVVQPANPGADARFDVMPADVAAELAAALTACGPPTAPFLLAVRRMPHVFNSMTGPSDSLRHRTPFNPAYLNPGDLAAAGLHDGDRVDIASDSGCIRAIVAADAAVRPRRGVDEP